MSIVSPDKAVVLSIKPKWCGLIASGEKEIEIRKTRPKIETPFKCYIYCTKDGTPVYGDNKCYVTDTLGLLNPKIKQSFKSTSKLYEWNGKVIGEFICNNIDRIHVLTELMWEKDIAEFSERTLNILNQSCLSYDDIINYSGCSLSHYNPRQEYLYAWHISALKMYTTPKPLEQFKKYNRTCEYSDLGFAIPDCQKCLNKNCYLQKPPQSWCYVEVLK